MTDIRFPFPDKDSSFSILESDPCFAKIPGSEVNTVFEDAWELGIRQARCFADEFPIRQQTMADILLSQGFQVAYEDTDCVIGNMRYFCEYSPGRQRVTVYQKSVALWADSHGFAYRQALDIILAHEYYHYLESTKIGWTSRRYLVPMVTLGPWHFGKTGIAALSEVGANAFANEYYSICIQSEELP